MKALFMTPTLFMSPTTRRAMLWAVCASLCLMLSGGAVGAQTADDHGNTAETATALALGGSVKGRIDPGFDRDYFRLDLSGQSGETDVWLYTTGDLDSLLFLLDSEGEILLLNDDSYITGRRTSSNIRGTVEPGEYYVVVRGYFAEVGEYTLHSEAVEKPGSSRSSATVLSLDTPIAGRIDSSDDADHFRFFVKSQTNLVIYALGLAQRDGNFELLPVAPLDATVTDSEGNELDLNIYLGR